MEEAPRWLLTDGSQRSRGRPEGWDRGVLPPLYPRAAPAPPSFRGAVLTLRLSQPAQERGFRFLSGAFSASFSAWFVLSKK